MTERNTTLYKIEKNVPFPTSTHLELRTGPKGDAISQTIDRLDVGDSFFIEDIGNVKIGQRIVQAKARNFADYTYRKEGENGVRIWRKSVLSRFARKSET